MKTSNSFRGHDPLKGVIPLLSLYFFLLVPGCKFYSAFNTMLNPEWENISQNDHNIPRIEYLNDIPVIHLYGNCRQMGEQYGSLLKKYLQAEELVVAKLFSEKKIRAYLEIARNAEPHLDTHTLDFIRGMCDSSEVDYLTMLAINTVPKTTCSVLAVWDEATPDGKLLMGRNADYSFKKINKSLGLIVVKHYDGGYSSVSSSFLGMAGSFTGINEKGVCFGNMLVYNGQEHEEYNDGLPIQVLMQTGAGHCASAKEFIDFLLRNKHATPVNVMSADANEAIIAELGQKNYALRKGSQGVLAASNYFYSPGMFTESVSDKRFVSLMQSAKQYHGIFNLDYMKEAMHKARKTSQNLQCVLFDPAEMKMYVSMNKVPASKGPFAEFDVRQLLGE